MEQSHILSGTADTPGKRESARFGNGRGGGGGSRPPPRRARTGSCGSKSRKKEYLSLSPVCASESERETIGLCQAPQGQGPTEKKNKATTTARAS
jgi:hypothetical protein